MNTYLVQWRIELDADDEHVAAEQALEVMRDESSLALAFDVCRIDPDGNSGPLVSIDPPPDA